MKSHLRVLLSEGGISTTPFFLRERPSGVNNLFGTHN